MAKGLYENEIGEELDQIIMGKVLEMDSLNSFECKKVPRGWVIEFKKKKFPGYTIKVKNTGQQRVFKTLDAVATWMKKMGINEFQVTL